MVNAATVGLITALHGTNGGAPTDLSGIVNVINKKADKSYVDTELDKKADTSDVDTKLSEKTDVNIFTQLKEKVDAISTQQNILTGSLSGASITATDSFAAPFVGLRVCGKSTQDGTPLPPAPVPIVSAGDGGSVSVTVCGKNLLKNTAKTTTKNGVTFTVNDNGSITVNGTASAIADCRICGSYDGTEPVFTYKAGRNYILSKGINTGSVTFAMYSRQSGSWISIKQFDSGSFIRFTPNNDGYITDIFIFIPSGATVNNVTVYPMIECGIVETTYEPYKESQTITVPTTNGLPGIPVTSGGNYTDENGQQWVCDEVDLARGVRVQRITKIKVTSSLSWQKAGIAVDRYFAWFSGIYTSNVLCTHFSTALGSETVGGAIANQHNLVGFAFAAKGTTTLDDFKAFLDANDVYIWAALESPVETAISTAEIAAYKALTAYAPTTVISVTDGACAEMKYQRDVNIVIKNLEDAIASMTQN